MNRNYRSLLLIGILAGGLFFFFTACRSIRPLARKALKERTFDQLYGKMVKSKQPFSYLQAKLSISYQKGNNEPVQLRAQMRLKNDSIIWISIVPGMGIEAARVVLTTDSVKLLNRLKKNYLIGSYHLLDSLMHTSINYDILQALLLGNNVTYPLIDSAAKVDRQQYLLEMKMQIPAGDSVSGSQFMTQKIWLDPETFNIKTLLLRESNMPGKDLQIFYNKYQKIDGYTIPLKMQIVINARQKIIISITYKKVDINIPHGFPLIIPGKYKKLI